MPDDPVLKARLNVLKQQQQDPFYIYQLPQAVISLKQGAGRLIRDHQDYGVLMIGDPRLYSKNYGSFFLNSLPNMKRTRNLKDVLNFFTNLKKSVL
jgi:ATP-dependent DNA helicase DinG